MPEMHRLYPICTLLSPVKNGPKDRICKVLRYNLDSAENAMALLMLPENTPPRKSNIGFSDMHVRNWGKFVNACFVQKDQPLSNIKIMLIVLWELSA